MTIDDTFKRVQVAYERLRADHPDLSHKELWRQAQAAAASNPDAFDEEAWHRTVTQRRSPGRVWVTVLAVVSAVALVVGLVVGIRSLSDKMATDRAAVATPVGTTTFAEVLRDSESYEGQVWRLEGPVDWLAYAPDSDTRESSPDTTIDPMTTTTRPAGSWVTIVTLNYFAWEHRPDDDPFGIQSEPFFSPDTLVLRFTYPTQTQVREGDQVAVTCRIVGRRVSGFMEARVVLADVCRSLVLLDS